MTDEIIPITSRREAEDVLVKKDRISIFNEGASFGLIEGIEDNQKVVFISVGPGETRVSVIDDTGRPITTWTAVFGWSSLCEIDILHHGDRLKATNIPMLTKALKGSLRVYGEAVDTSSFQNAARATLGGAVRHIVDETIGDGREFDRIIMAAPSWMHIALGDCLNIRPHFDPEIQDL